jgi:beta-lactamase regulating signal transducer with metallopeptidase domain
MSALLFAGEIIAAATVILLVTHILAALTSRASQRHLVRLSGLLALILLPLAALLPSAIVLPAAPPSAVMVRPDASPHVMAWLVIAIALLWAAGCVALLARGFAGAVALAALRRRSQPHDFDAARLTSWARRAQFGGGWTLRVSAAAESPLSWGILRPTILLPVSCARWNPAQLDAAMLHELALLRRRDAISQALALICCALYWPHPLAWLETKALRADAEKAADDAVILSGVRQSDYAALLLGVATGATGWFAGLEMAMAERAGLEARIQSVLAPDVLRTGVTRMQIFKTASLGMGAVLLFALTRPTLAADPAAPLPVERAVPQSMLAQTGPSAQPVEANHPLPARRERKVRADIAEVTIDQKIMGADIDKKIADAHIGEKVAAALAKMNIDQKIADAHIGEQVAAALAKANIDQKIADAHIGEQVAAALAKANIDQKIADAHIGEKVAAALAKANIDQKIAEALKRLDTQNGGALEDTTKPAQDAPQQP